MKDIIKVANTDNGITNEELQAIVDEVIKAHEEKPLKRFYCSPDFTRMHSGAGKITL